MKAFWDVVQLGDDNSGEHVCGIDGGVLRMQEAGVIAAVAEEELLFEACVGICECVALRLEEWVEAIAGCDDIEPHKAVVAGESNDVLCHG